MMLACASVVSGEIEVGGFEVYFLGLGSQLGGWGYSLLRGYEEVLEQNLGFLGTLNVKCKPRERLGEGCWGYTLKVGEHVDGILELRMESISREWRWRRRLKQVERSGTWRWVQEKLQKWRPKSWLMILIMSNHVESGGRLRD